MPADDAPMMNPPPMGLHANPQPAPPQQVAPQQSQPAQSVPVPAPHPDFTSGPVEPGKQRERTLWIAESEWAATQARLRELSSFKSEYDKMLDAKEAERSKAMAEKGQFEQALAKETTRWEAKLVEQQQRAQTIEQNWLKKETAIVLRDVLAGHEFVGQDPRETAQLVYDLLEREIEAVIGTDGQPYVRDRVTLRPAVDYLKERLTSPRFSIFFKAKSGGGSGTDGTRTDATPTNLPALGLTPDQIVRGWQTGNAGIGPVGLSRKQA